MPDLPFGARKSEEIMTRSEFVPYSRARSPGRQDSTERQRRLNTSHQMRKQTSRKRKRRSCQDRRLRFRLVKMPAPDHFPLPVVMSRPGFVVLVTIVLSDFGLLRASRVV